MFGRQRTRWRDEIGCLAGVIWNRRAIDRDEWRKLGGGPCPAVDLEPDDDNEAGDNDDDIILVYQISLITLRPP